MVATPSDLNKNLGWEGGTFSRFLAQAGLQLLHLPGASHQTVLCRDGAGVQTSGASSPPYVGAGP